MDDEATSDTANAVAIIATVFRLAGSNQGQLAGMWDASGVAGGNRFRRVRLLEATNSYRLMRTLVCQPAIVNQNALPRLPQRPKAVPVVTVA
jgi:hypothetical protein